MEAWYVADACGRTVLQDVHHSTLSGLSLYKGIERAVANPEQWEQSGRLCHPLKAEGVWRCCCWVSPDRSERNHGVVTA
jgi:hypothetical protein